VGAVPVQDADCAARANDGVLVTWPETVFWVALFVCLAAVMIVGIITREQ
jgi:hypothetical protein